MENIYKKKSSYHRWYKEKFYVLYVMISSIYKNQFIYDNY